MAAIIVILLGLSCCSSLSAAGGWFGGFIPGTEPHFLKTIEAPLMKKLDKKIQKLTQKRNDMGNFGPEGPTDEEDKKKLLDFFENVKNGDVCKTIKEKDFKSKIDGYEWTDILRLPSFEYVEKTQLLKSYLYGDGADATDKEKNLNEFGGMCMMSDDEWNLLTSKLK
jgi:hypothetical protein